jgi:peptide/nickel transport system substrate-binding protein
MRRQGTLHTAGLTGLLLVAAAGTAFGQSLPNVPRNKTLVVAHDTEAPVYRNVGLANPYSVNNEDYRGSIINMFEPLFYFNSMTNKVVPWIGTDYSYDPGFTSVTVKLHDGVTWSDGQPFTADDVVYTLNMLIANGNGKKDLFYGTNLADDVKAVTKIDRLTVKIDFKRPDPRFAYKYLINYFDTGLQWLPEHIWKDQPDPGAFTFYDLAKGWPVTTGPWKLTRFSDTQVFMDRRDDWWAVHAGLATMPAVERIITIPSGTVDRAARLIISNQVDIATDLGLIPVIKQVFSQNPKVITFTGQKPPYGTLDVWPTSLYFNNKSPKWQDPNLRHAVNYYINRQQVSEICFSGANQPKFDPFPGSGALQPYIDAIHDIAVKYGIGIYDKAKGDAAMEKAGFKKGQDGFWEKDGKRFTVAIEAIPALNVVAPVVAQQLKNAGIEATFHSSPESRALMRDGKFDLTLFGHRGSIADPYPTLEMYTCKNAYDIGQPTLFPARWCNKDYDKVVDQAEKIPPNDPRLIDLTKQAMEIWMRDAVEVPITEWYHRIPMNQTYWVGWPQQDNPYMQPDFWNTSGSFSYVLWQLKPAS